MRSLEGPGWGWLFVFRSERHITVTQVRRAAVQVKWRKLCTFSRTTGNAAKPLVLGVRNRRAPIGQAQRKLLEGGEQVMTRLSSSLSTHVLFPAKFPGSYWPPVAGPSTQARCGLHWGPSTNTSEYRRARSTLGLGFDSPVWNTGSQNRCSRSPLGPGVATW